MKITAEQLQKLINEAVDKLISKGHLKESPAFERLKEKVKSDIKNLLMQIDYSPPYKMDNLVRVDDLISDAVNEMSSEGPTTDFSSNNRSLVRGDIPTTSRQQEDEEGYRNLREAAENGAEMTSAKDMTAFMKSFDDMIEKSIEDARKLADEGEDLLKANLLKSAEAEVRNEIVKYRVGMLRTMANNMATVFERVKRFEP